MGSFHRNILKKFFLTSIFENIYYFLTMYMWLMLSIIGTGLSIAVILFVLEWMFPQDIHILNYSLTDRTFKELYTNHNYHAAIFLAEQDTSYVNDDLTNIPNKDMLRECYLHVGEYSKAEKIGRDFLNLNVDINQVPKDQQKITKLGINVMHTVAARDLFRLYEKMGDREKQLEMYAQIKKFFEDPQSKTLYNELESQGFELPVIDADNTDMYTLEHNLKYDLICGMYLENPEAAMDSLRNYISEVWQLPKFKPSLKLTYLNRLLSWYIEHNEVFAAQGMLLNGFSVIPTISKESELEPLGDFAEYCYILHDFKSAKRYMNMYMRYMRKYYSEDDLDYLIAEVRFIKYREKNLNENVKDLTHCCRGLREQISKNFAGMTAIQQEYFSDKLKEPFDFALQLLDKNPNNEDLVELCFENEIFNRGLLLRSDALLRKALHEAKDSTLLEDYNRYIGYKRELVARDEIVGPGNFAQRMYLKNQIASLEKELTVSCAEFARQNYEEASYSQIKSELESDESLITYIEIQRAAGLSLGAFVLNKKNGLSFIKLCSNDIIDEIEKTDILDLCVDASTYKKIFAKLENELKQTKHVIYSPAGVINRIPIAALYIDDNTTIGDRYDLTVLANPIDAASSSSKDVFDIRNMNVSLWGGINYGNSPDTNEMIVQTRAIMRGRALEYLPGSEGEVSEISRILGGTAKTVKTYTGDKATEGTFKAEASNATIIHVSTHGFFNEDEKHKFNSAMHNSGLFFANANKAWKEEYRPEFFSKEYEDGILRADEIETQNLANCKLVVLSACETGLGEIKGDEGVYGLQRAFKLAGAQYILMSLWSVPDAPTEELMTRFYNNLISGNNVDVAFSKAQKSMKSKYGVRDWGGFVLLH